MNFPNNDSPEQGVFTTNVVISDTNGNLVPLGFIYIKANPFIIDPLVLERAAIAASKILSKAAADMNRGVKTH